MAAILGAAAYANRREATAEPRAVEASRAPPDDRRTPSVTVDPLGIEVGYALVTIVDEKQGGSLLGRVRAIRKQIATETGMVVPPVHVADNLQLGPRTYAILVKGVEVARGELFTDRLLAINPGHGAARRSRASPTREPAFGLPAIWITQEQRDSAIAAGYTVVDPTTAISTHLSEVIRTFLPELLTRQQTKELIDRVGADVAEARRGARAEGRLGRRRAARAAPAAARARAGARPDDHPRSDGRRGGGLEGSGRHRRGRARGARPIGLPRLSDRDAANCA